MAAAAFPGFHVTGPVHHYVAPFGLGDPLYLGTAEVQPRVQVSNARKQIMNDIAGTSLAAQEKDDGQIAAIGVLLNRFSQTTLFALRPSGFQARFSRGQLVYGYKTFALWMVFENFLDAATRAMYPNLPIGYYWPQVDWVDIEDAPGNQDQKVMCQWKASNQWTGQASPDVVADGERSWFLYSQNVAYFPASVLVPQ